MEITDPVTVEEWGAYISTLNGAKLFSVAAAANSLEFVRSMQDEGFPNEDITDILLLFAMRFQQVDLDPPVGFPGEYLSYIDLLDSAAR